MTKDAKEAERRRLAEALRANLSRRKAVRRSESSKADADGGPKPAGDGENKG